jgi:ParB family chromosome partitioning protein
MIAVETIDPDPQQPRRVFHSESVDALASSIKKYGVLQPLIVRKEGARYVLLAGERRYRACLSLGLREVPALMREDAGLSAFEIALVENLQREDLNAVDEAEAYQRLINEGSRSQTEIGAIVGKSRVHVSNTLRLLKLESDYLNSVRNGGLSTGHARALLMVSDPEARRGLYERIFEEGWSVRRAEKEAKALASGSPRRSREPHAMAPYYDSLARDLQGVIGSKVSIKARGSKGKVEISFDDLDKLKALIHHLTSAPLRKGQEPKVAGESSQTH